MTLPAEREIFGGDTQGEGREGTESDRPEGGDKAALRTNYLQIIRLEINLHVRAASQ